MELLKTPFYQKHLQAGARMVDFTGWSLPIEYKSMLQEAKSVRNSCGIFDASHMGEIIIKGQKSVNFLQRFVSNDISSIGLGKMQYNLFLNKNGGVIDDAMLYSLKGSLLCVVNAINKDKVFNQFKNEIDDGVEVIDNSDKMALISIQGPSSSLLIESVFGSKVSGLGYMNSFESQLEGKDFLISRSGYTGEDGFEIYISWQDGIYWWDVITSKGKDFGLTLCGLGSRDILRIEAGYPLYGHEISEDINPYEASLGWAVKYSKDFIGKEELTKIKNQSSMRKRIGLVMQARVFPRQGYPLHNQGKQIGVVTSGAYSPNLDKFIAMGYIDPDCTLKETGLEVMVRGQLHKANVVKFPFLETNTKSIKIAKEA